MESVISMAQQIAESNEEFRNQFDVNNPNHHKGDTTPFPINGQRVPASMPTEYSDKPQEEQQTEFGPEYEKVQKLRDNFTELKKFLSKITVTTEAIFRLKDQQDKKIEEQSKIKQDSKEIQKYIELIKKDSREGYQDKYIVVVEQILIDCHQDFQTKETLTDFNFKVKQVSSLMFNETKKLLEEMKKIKKELKK